MTIYRKYTLTEIKEIANDLKQQLSEGGLPEDSLEKFKFRGPEGKTWTVNPENGEWYVSTAGSWQEGDPPDQPLDGSLEILDLAALPLSPLEHQPPEDTQASQPRGDFLQVIEDAVRRVRENYVSGRLNSGGAEILLRDLCLLDPAGLIWSCGMYSEKWYFFREEDWELAEDQRPDPQDFETKPAGEPLICSSCGASLKGGKFCSECGTPVSEPERSYTQAAVEVVERFHEVDADPLPEPVVPPWEPGPGYPDLKESDDPLAEEQKTKFDQPEQPDPEPRKPNRTVFLVFVLVFAATCLCCFTAGLGGYFLSEDRPQIDWPEMWPFSRETTPDGGSSSQIADLGLSDLPQEITDSSGHPMLLVPAGAFEMGADAGLVFREFQQLVAPEYLDIKILKPMEPVHTVTLDDYYIDKYEVTNAQFAEFLNEVGNQQVSGTEWLNEESEDALIIFNGGSWQAKDGYEGHPVIEVSWYGARAYCQWRGARLPSEAEWEKAARGTDGRLYSWGNDYDGGKLNVCDRNCPLPYAIQEHDDGYSRTAPVDAYPDGISPYGVFNMIGNASEWTADWLDVYPGGDPEAADDFGRVLRVKRGGSWSTTGAVGATYRAAGDPAQPRNSTGFRCSRWP